MHASQTIISHRRESIYIVSDSTHVRLGTFFCESKLDVSHLVLRAKITRKISLSYIGGTHRSQYFIEYVVIALIS